MDERVKTLLLAAGYTGIQPLGSGAFATVYRGESKKGKLRALKVAIDERGRRAAAREVSALRAIPKHKNLIRLVDTFSSEDCTVVVTPLQAEGDSLKLMMRRRCTGLPEDDARRLFTQLVDVVAHIHRSGYVHRDIKCENILLRGHDARTLVLADLGFAGTWQKGEKHVVKFGSPHYTSPEMVNGQPYEGPEVDVWAMGVVLYAWTAGRLPFGGHTDEALAREILAANFYIPLSFSADLRNLLTRLLEPDVARRITIEELRLHPWLRLTQQLIIPPSPRTPRDVSRNVSAPAEISAVIDVAEAVESVRLTEVVGSPRTGRSASLGAIVPILPERKKRGGALGGSAIGLLKFFTKQK